MTRNLEHLLSLARRGKNPGASSGEQRAFSIVSAIVENFVALDGRAQDGVHELVELIASDNGSRHDIKDMIGINQVKG